MEACASLEYEIPAEGLLSADKVVGEAPSVETTVSPPLPARRSDLVIPGLYKPRGPDKLVVNSCVKLMKWDHLLRDTFTFGPNAAQSIIDRWNPFQPEGHFCHQYARTVPH